MPIFYVFKTLQALDEIDGHGFGRFARNFDEIDRAGFGGRFV